MRRRCGFVRSWRRFRGDAGSAQPGLQEHSTFLGYAWAASSYSANFYDVRAAIEDTNRLALNLTDILARDWSVEPGEVTQYLIVGVSMGGHAAVERETMETARYEGALPRCQVEQNEFFWVRDYNRAAMDLTGGERPIFDEGFSSLVWQFVVLGTGGAAGTITGILAKDFCDNTGRVYRWTDGERFTGQERAFTAKVDRF